ncbi:MAG: thioesterase family protein [Rickettsiales bacterium]|jgi:acyl-CoA thioester hydrolase|nr:thioesterase family protein [Rickettsiales bacterium]
MKPHIFDFQIAYADTDAGGIVYHARYVEIAERARMNLFRDINDENGGFVIKELNVKYMKPLHLNDQFIIETIFTSHTAATMDVEQKFIKDGGLYAVLTGTAVYVNNELKPARIPDVWLKLLED